MRDETLERLMTELVEGIDPRPEDSRRRVINRGSRRRAVRWTAIGSALAAFVLVVAGAGLWVVDHQGEPAAPGGMKRTYVAPGGDWTLQYPSTWFTQPYDETLRLSEQGVLVSNVDHEFVHPDLGPNTTTTAWSMEALPPDAVVVEFKAWSGGPMPPEPGTVPDTPMPLSLEDAKWRSDGTRFFLPVVHDNGNYTLQGYIAEGASASDRALAEEIAVSIEFPTKYRTASMWGFSWAFPKTWHMGGNYIRTGPMSGQYAFVSSLPEDQIRAAVVTTPKREGFGTDRYLDTTQLPPQAVVVELRRPLLDYGPKPETPLPLEVDLASGKPDGNGLRTEVDVVNQGRRFLLSSWVGFDASEADIEAARDVISSLTFEQLTRARVIARFPVGPRGQSTALTTGGGYLWVAAYGLEGDSYEGVLAIDPNNGKVVATVPAPVPGWETGGGGLTYAFGSIWVGGWTRHGGVVTRIDPATFEVQARIPMPEGRGPAGGVADLDAASASMWVALKQDVKDEARVVRINGTTNEVTGDIYIPQETPRRIVATDEVVIAQGWSWEHGGPQNYYNAIDPDSMELRNTFDSGVYAGPAPGIVEHNGDIWGLYSEGPDRQGIARLDPMTAEPFADRTLFAPNHAPRSFVISGDGGIWFGAYPGGSGGSGDNLSFLDTQTHAITTYGKGGGTPTMLGGDLWFLGWDGVLERVDLDGTSSPTAPTPNPCDLLQSWEVERELDIQLNEVRWMEPDEFHMPPKPWPDGSVACKYGSNGRFGDVIVSIEPMNLAEFRERFVENQPFDPPKPVDGVGDVAVIDHCGGLTAYQDGLEVSIGSQYLDCGMEDELAALTRLALERATGIPRPQM